MAPIAPCRAWPRPWAWTWDARFLPPPWTSAGGSPRRSPGSPTNGWNREGAVSWPCPDADRPGTAKLYGERFATADGRAHLAAVPYLPPGESPDADDPLVLMTGRWWTSYNSGSMTRRSGNLRLDPVDLLDVHPDDATRHGLCDRAPAVVENRHGGP
ncbi:molybdopterin dinucleotide binding domain-containing protein [Streptomyces sp. NPDC056323]|uniref:molybdopterin dinucleotide binding domain-containing protein n=1 Tax=Streptomyces sp. NPDC056323 TaxID=3345784 RepID=UPI0035D55610